MIACQCKETLCIVALLEYVQRLQCDYYFDNICINAQDKVSKV